MKFRAKAIQSINEKGVLLVFPMKSNKSIPSLWSSLHPRTEMRWDWDETGDDRVVNLWHGMKELSESWEVVYSKWYQNRATFFSRDFFKNYLAYFHNKFDLNKSLMPEARAILEELRVDSPLSTRELKELTELKGRLNESLYNKAMRQLFQRGLIVGFGEKEDGAFPSSLMGATELLFEDLYREALTLDPQDARKVLSLYLENQKNMDKQFRKIEENL